LIIAFYTQGSGNRKQAVVLHSGIKSNAPQSMYVDLSNKVSILQNEFRKRFTASAKIVLMKQN